MNTNLKSAFKDLYNTGNLSYSTSLLSSDNKKALATKIEKQLKIPGTPACHLNFRALGSINFDFSSLFAADPVNMNLFKKLKKISIIVKEINSRLISMINDLQCCGLAKLYNSTVVPLFEHFLHDFVNQVGQVAAELLKMYEVFRVMVCIVRPVPGNPWFPGGNWDPLLFIYSYIEGFAALYDWVINGNILDIILKPLQSINSSIASCTSITQEQYNIIEHASATFEKAIEDHTYNNNYILELISNANNQREEQQNLIKQNMDIINQFADAYSEAVAAVQIKYSMEFIEAGDSTFNSLVKDEMGEEDYNAYIEAITNCKDISFQIAALDDNINTLSEGLLNVDNYYVNEERRQKAINRILYQAVKPGCNCIMHLLEKRAGSSWIDMPKLVTFNSWASFNGKVQGKVSYDDRSIWRTKLAQAYSNNPKIDASQDEWSDLYIDKDNIDVKYSAQKGSVVRDLMNISTEIGNYLNKLNDYSNTTVSVIQYQTAESYYQDKMNSLMVEKDQLENEYSDKQSLLTSLIDEQSALHTELDVTKTDIENLKNEIANTTDPDKLNTLNNQLYSTQSKQKALTNDYNKQAIKVSNATSAVTDVLDNISKNEDDYNSAIDGFNNARHTITEVEVQDDTVDEQEWFTETIFTNSLDQMTNVSEALNLNEARLTAMKKIQRSISTVSSEIQNTEFSLNILYNSLKRKYIENMDLYRELQQGNITLTSTLHDTKDTIMAKDTSTALLMYKLGTSFVAFDFINNFGGDEFPELMSSPSFSDLKDLWIEKTNELFRLEEYYNRLYELTQIDTFGMNIVNEDFKVCGCDIICKLVQYVLDIIMSVINEFVKMLMVKIAEALIDKKVVGILKFILAKLKCIIQATQISNNIKKIEAAKKALIEFNKSIEKMEDSIFCSTSAVATSRLRNDEIIIVDPVNKISSDDNGNFSDNTTIDPMPSWGENSYSDNEFPENTLDNVGADQKESYTYRNIPSLYFNCTETHKPYLDLKLAPLDAYEFLLVFSPGDNINNEPRVVQQSLSEQQTVFDIGNGMTFDTSKVTNPIVDLSAIMTQVTKQVQEIQNTSVYNDACGSTPLSNSKSISLCSREALYVKSIYIIKDDEKVLDDRYGKLSNVKYVSNSTILEYYPKNSKAVNGYMPIISGEKYWTYTRPATETIIHDPVVKVEEDYVPIKYSDTSTTTLKVYENNYSSFSNEIVLNVVYEDTDLLDDSGNVLYLRRSTTTTTTTETKPFRAQNLEILVQFANQVNTFSVRMLLDVLSPYESDKETPYISSGYNGRYRDYVEIGRCSGDETEYQLSFNKIVDYCSNALRSNYMIPSLNSTIDSITNNYTNSKNSLDNDDSTKGSGTVNSTCLLPSNVKQPVIDTQSMVSGLTAIVDSMQTSITNVTDNITSTETTPVDTNLPLPLKFGIPLLALNEENNVYIQIVDSKIYLQFPVTSINNSIPYIIDFTLVPHDIYMLSVKINSALFTLTLYTPDKEQYSVSGLNTSDFKLQPTKIGGNGLDWSFCSGTIYDIIVSKTGAMTVDYYNRSIMSYVPRSSVILFDFETVKGSRVYNSISSTGTGYIKNTDDLYGYFGSGEPIPAAKQRADYYGEIKENDYYKVLSGYMDNFFCKDNLTNTDFTISFWVYNKGYTSARYSLISDDINNNYIYFNAYTNKIVIDLNGSVTSIPWVFSTWTNISFSRERFKGTYALKLRDLNGNTNSVTINNKNKFFLMSLLAEYSKPKKAYYNEFQGYLSTISIFMYAVTDDVYNDLFKNQSILVRGMEK